MHTQVARDEGLYEYTPDTRAGCTVFEGTKQLLLSLGRFVVVVSGPWASSFKAKPRKISFWPVQTVFEGCKQLLLGGLWWW